MNEYPLPPRDPMGHANRLLMASIEDARAGHPPAILSRRGTATSVAAGVMMMASALSANADQKQGQSIWDRVRAAAEMGRDLNALRALDGSQATTRSTRSMDNLLRNAGSAAKRMDRSSDHAAKLAASDDDPDDLHLSPRGPEPH